ncbi:MAG: hypothetical protein AB7W16_05825 [Candidatus Obscuribacterales bacterium]
MDQPDEIYYEGMLVFCRILKAAPGGYLVSVAFISQPTFMYSNNTYEKNQEVRARIESIDSEGVILKDASDELSGKRKKSSEPVDKGVPARKRKRGIDLFPPPFEPEKKKAIRGKAKETVLAELASKNFTGCLTLENNRKKNRGAMLLYRGRAVGCVHTSMKRPMTESTPDSLETLLPLVPDAGSKISIHELPDQIVLPMASIFLGYPVTRQDDYTALDYLEYICSWLRENRGIAILAVTFAKAPATALIFIYKGVFTGAYLVEHAAYLLDFEKVKELLSLDREASLEVAVLPPEPDLGPDLGYTLD